MSVMPDKEEKMWGMISHLGVFAGNIIPFSNILVPLLIWQIKKDESPFIAHHGKESLNFQITILIYLAVGTVLSFLLIGIPLLIAVWVASLVFVVIAGLKANEGEYYRYPLTIRLIK